MTRTILGTVALVVALILGPRRPGGVGFLRSVARFSTGLLDPRRWVDREPALPAYARP